MTQLELHGSCLCGTVQYEVTGRLRGFYHCHCSRCRKATGTGHATNIMLHDAQLHWRAGESAIRDYRVPQASRFRNAFCTTCGGPVPRHITALDAVVVPAGSLDSEVPLRPAARIFLDSRASWSCDDSPVPGYPEYAE